MHLDMEVLNGDTLVFDNIDEEFKIVIDIKTGEVIHLEYLTLNIQRLEKLIHHANVRYKKFLHSKAIKDFME